MNDYFFLSVAHQIVVWVKESVAFGGVLPGWRRHLMKALL
jgi:hypothetical protein